MTRERFRLGEFEVFGLRDGFFSIDGGAMFGVVPKSLWEKKCPSDAQNRIRLALNSILIKTRRALVLVETGIGSKLDAKMRSIYCVEQDPGLLGSLARLGFGPEEVDFVINTHLHFDHCGGNTQRNEKGEVVPAFPRARYIIQRGEWEWANNPHEREKGSYLPENFSPLADFGQLQLVEGDAQVAEGVTVARAPGHTEYHQCVLAVSGGKTAAYLGDLVPTSAHVALAYGMSFDLQPLQNLETKRRFYERAIAEDWVLSFVHDPEHYFGKVKRTDRKYEFEPLV